MKLLLICVSDFGFTQHDIPVNSIDDGVKVAKEVVNAGDAYPLKIVRADNNLTVLNEGALHYLLEGLE